MTGIKLQKELHFYPKIILIFESSNFNYKRTLKLQKN